MTPRTTLALVTVLELMASLAGHRDLQAQAERPSFRAGVDLISLSVTVVDRTQQYVADLTADDFVVFENNVPQKLTFFGKTGVPLALALLLDTSASMEASLPTAQHAAVEFARQLGGLDVASVIDFGSRVQILQDFTTDRAALEDAIRRAHAGGSTALYNALYIALKELNKVMKEDETQQGPRRRAMILLSDGEDTSSLVTFDEILDLASRSSTVIYTIGLTASDPLGTRGVQANQFVLRRLAQQTGGRAFFPLDVKDLTSVYGEIRLELSTQYSLAYESSIAQKDGQWRRIAVRVDREGTFARTRPGYYAPKK